MTFEEIEYLSQIVAVLGIFGSLVLVGPRASRSGYFRRRSPRGVDRG